MTDPTSISPSQRALLAQVEAFLARTGMSERSFGRRVAKDGNLVRRMRVRPITYPTGDLILAFMRDNPDGAFDLRRRPTTDAAA
jgi:hypothetical protein